MIKIVTLGDSITYGFDSAFKTKTKAQVATPYPVKLQELLGSEFQVINSGNIGWQAKQTKKYLDSLVFRHKPDYCILMLGINDARGSSQGLPVSKKKFSHDMQEIINAIKSKNIKLIILTPTPVKFWRVRTFIPIIENLSKNNNLQLIDVHKALLEQVKVDTLILEDIIPDKVHLTQNYYLHLAEIIYQQLPPELSMKKSTL